MNRTGIVLSGGGARGVAHLGVLAALDDLGVYVSALSGTSAGAIVAALYAGGLAPATIKELVKDSSYFGISHFLLGKPGLFDMESMRELLVRHLPGNRFEDLPRRVFITATNLTTGKSQTFSEGPLLEPILASACVPVIFRPVGFAGCEYVDGGVLNNFPVEALGPHCSFVIGSHVNHLAETKPSSDHLHIPYILDRCFHLAIAHAVYEKARLCHLFLDHPGMEGFGLFDTKRADELFDIGYNECMARRDQLPTRLQEKDPVFLPGNDLL